MTSEQWKQKQIEYDQLGRQIRDEVGRVYLVPTWEDGPSINTAIAIRLGERHGIEVVAVYAGFVPDTAGLAAAITEVSELDVFTLEALARTKREVNKWYYDEREELPTAKELGLIDAADHPHDRRLATS